MSRTHPIMRWLLAVYWLALIAATHWPRLSFAPNDAVVFGLDKWLHVICFGLLSLFCYGARLFGDSGRGRRWAFPLLIAALYVPIDEITQNMMPGRSFSFGDLAASWLGVIAGAGVYGGWRWLSRPSHSFVANTRVMSILTFISRVFGLGREWALAFAFGFSPVLDAYAIAFMIPNLFRRLFGEGSLAVAFLPGYAQLDRDAPATARRFGRSMLRWLVLLLVAVSAVSVLILAGLLLFGDLDERGTLAARLTGMMIWYMPLVCTAAILGAMLQVHGRFAAPAAAPVLLNVAVIVAAIGSRTLWPDMAPGWRTHIVALAVLVAGGFQVTWLIATLHEARGAAGLDEPVDGDRLRDAKQRLFARWVPMLFGLAVLQVNTLLDALIAMFFSGEAGETLHWFGDQAASPMREGAVAVLGATARLYEFPLGVFAVALATAIYPALSRASDDRPTFAALVRRGLRLSWFIALPAGVGLILVRRPLAEAIFAEAGALKAEDSARVAWVLLGYAPAIWAYSMNQLLTRVFYARDDARTPVRVAAGMVLLNLVLNLTLMWLPAPANPMGPRLGVAGLAWSTAICATLQCVILLMLVRRHVERPLDRAVVGGWLRTAVATLAMAAAVWVVVRLGPTWFDRTTESLGRGGSIVLLVAAVATGGAVMMLVARLLGMAELRWALGDGDE